MPAPWPTTVSALDLTQKWQAPGVVVFLFLFFWAVGAIFVVRGLLKSRGRRR